MCHIEPEEESSKEPQYGKGDAVIFIFVDFVSAASLIKYHEEQAEVLDVSEDGGDLSITLVFPDGFVAPVTTAELVLVESYNQDVDVDDLGAEDEYEDV